uniref:Uncharacterized protein n=1 Tax=Enterobacter sp. HP19 TaxID=1811975 RepID=A0A2H4UDY1_9ENTR|nr:hypothetical protein [Enterobacter sp. HP19]
MFSEDLLIGFQSRHATPRRTVSVTICPHNAFHLHLSGLTSGREGAAPQALALPSVSPKG